MRQLQVILLPFSYCYGFILKIRNLLFDLRILKERAFDHAIISIGNLSVGGTGKTPLIEYLIRLLIPNNTVATLSRGYGRKGKGFVLASKRSNVKYIGDEPLQVTKKFEGVRVAVDEKRSRGVQLLLEKYPENDVILLDDAFQHRYVKPGLSILLTDYHRLYSDDHVLPSGTLREFRSGAKRADIIIVTKTPKIFSPITRRRILEELKPEPDQTVLFSFLIYGNFMPLYDSVKIELPSKLTNILLVSGIGNDYPLREHLERLCTELFSLRFQDHHPYTEKDLEKIQKVFRDLPTQKKIIVTTEKDMMRLKTPEFSSILKSLPIFYIPIEVTFHGTDKEIFDNEIINYVRKNKRDH